MKIARRSGEFFEMFVESARNLRSGADLLKDLLEDYTDVESKAQRVKDREHEGDEITHSIIRRLNTTFITPMDREDIYELASALDDIMDSIEAVADLFVLHRIEEPIPDMKAQVDVIIQAAAHAEQALTLLPKMAREKLEPHWLEINRLEDEGDKIYRKTVADLFSGDYKAMDVLKWKEVVENLEHAIDGLQKLSNIIEAAVLKHA
jgi:predicted phosphate transport protein (TIGR00153 family)